METFLPFLSVMFRFLQVAFTGERCVLDLDSISRWASPAQCKTLQWGIGKTAKVQCSAHTALTSLVLYLRPETQVISVSCCWVCSLRNSVFISGIPFSPCSFRKKLNFPILTTSSSWSFNYLPESTWPWFRGNNVKLTTKHFYWGPIQCRALKITPAVPCLTSPPGVGIAVRVLGPDELWRCSFPCDITRVTLNTIIHSFIH